MIVIPVRWRKPASASVLPDRWAARRHRDPLDRQLADRHLELLDDLRPLVGAAEDRAELARLLVLELDDRGRLLGGRPVEE